MDLNKLEQEWVQLPRKIGKVAEETALAEKEKRDSEKELELAKLELEELEAELDIAIRDNPESYEVGKINNEVVKNIIICHPERKKKAREVLAYKEKVNEVELKLNLLKGKLKGLETDKSGLENNVKLWIAGYWNTPHIDNEAFRERMRREGSKIGSGKKRREKMDE